jgi:hypothetical protein
MTPPTHPEGATMTRLQLTVLSLLTGLALRVQHLQTATRSRPGRWSPDSERGSLTTEQAVITGILVVAAVGLGVLITAVVSKYGSKIK